MPVLLRPVNNFMGQVIGNASEGKYNTVNNSSSVEVTFQKCLNSGITLFSSKNSNKSQTFATGAYQRLHEARPRRVVWLWEPEWILADFHMFFDHQRADNGPIFVKNLSGLALTPMSVTAKLEVHWSRNFHYIARKRVTEDRQTDNGVYRAARSQLKIVVCGKSHSLNNQGVWLTLH